VRATDTDLLIRNLPSWKALGSDDLILCSNGWIDTKITEGCRTLDSSQAEAGWYYRQGGARRLGFLNAKHDIILTGDIDLTVTRECLRAVELVKGDIGMVSLEKRRGAHGSAEAVRNLSKRMLRRIRHRLFFTGLYAINRRAWLAIDDTATSKLLTNTTHKGEDLLLKEAMLRSSWKVVYLPVVGGIDHRTSLEDRPAGQVEAGRKAWAQQLSPFSVIVRALIYFRPQMMGSYLHYANQSGRLGQTLVKIPKDGASKVVRRVFKRRAPGAEAHLEAYMRMDPAKTFVDAGANIGHISRYMAPRSRSVWAFEPSASTAEELRARTREFGNVVVQQCALGDKDGEAELLKHDSSGNNSLVRRSKDFTSSTEKVEVKRLDDFIDSFPSPVGLIKIDVEGYESFVIRGALNLVARDRPRLVVEIHPPFEENEVAVRALLPTYSWRKVWRPTRNQFHLIGDPRQS
jgi:FkbM family methyltransferase